MGQMCKCRSCSSTSLHAAAGVHEAWGVFTETSDGAGGFRITKCGTSGAAFSGLFTCGGLALWSVGRAAQALLGVWGGARRGPAWGWGGGS